MYTRFIFGKLTIFKMSVPSKIVLQRKRGKCINFECLQI